MWYQVLVPAPVLLIPILIMTTKGTHHTPKNDSNVNSDVIVTYSNHAEAGNVLSNRILPITEKSNESTTTIVPSEYTTERPRLPLKQTIEEEPIHDDVIFVPNEREVVRNEDYLQHNNVNLQDIMGGQRTVEEMLSKKNLRLETESPNTDIIFVMGKNNENNDHSEKEKPSRKWTYDDRHYKTDTSTPSTKLNCSNLNCNNAIKSVCGGKVESQYWRYRLFLNDCYFRKVNCNFRNVINRYKLVPLDNCKNSGAHNNQTAFSFKPSAKFDYKPMQVNNTRRSSSSRRSMTMSIDGQFCSHPCPVTCPDHYAPECARSSTGRHRVFVNHCSLDHNSCFFGIVWHNRPLSECVGGKKADMQQNSGFIGWMQRVGIVDNKGRLVLS